MQIIKSNLTKIKNESLKPIYLLMGDEDFLIDEFYNKFESENFFQKEKPDKLIYQAKEIKIKNLLIELSSVSLFSQFKVIIIKESQNLKDADLLINYISNPQTKSMLILLHRGKMMLKTSKLYKQIQKVGFVFESKKIYDNEVPEFIKDYCESYGYKMDIETSNWISQNLGNDLGVITKEFQKLFDLVKKGEKLDISLFEKYSSINRGFNLFELNKALSQRKLNNILEIVEYFSENIKNFPFILVLSSMYNFFLNGLIFISLEGKQDAEIVEKLKVNPRAFYFIKKDYLVLTKNYNKTMLLKVLEILKIYDLKAKGVKNNSFSDADLLKEVVLKIYYSFA